MLNIPLGPLIVDVQGTLMGTQDRLLLSQPAVGGVILFSRNFECRSQVKTLIREIKDIRTPKLLIAVDQEGGRIQRFKTDFFTLPAVSQFGKQYDQNPADGAQLSYSAGFLMASELKAVGVDISFAPVLDRLSMGSAVIGDRAFHSDPVIISRLASAFIRGMNHAGMGGIGKHFPGHGGVKEDSHLVMPIDRRSLDRLGKTDLMPYRILAKKLNGIMTAHIQYPSVDDELPTFSKYWLQQILRKEMGFEGLIFSDDLSMKGAHIGGNPIDRTRKALQAGCDLALICNDYINALAVAESLNTDFRVDPIRIQQMTAQTTQSPDHDIALFKQKLSKLV